MPYVVMACRSLLFVIFLASTFGKIRSPMAFKTFKSWLAELPVPLVPAFAGLAAITIGIAEVAILLLLALPWTVSAGFALALATLTLFTVGAWLAVRHGTHVSCQCFGASDTPLGRRHVARDASLCMPALAGLVSAPNAGVRPAAVLLSLTTGLVIGLLVARLDDLVMLFGHDQMHQQARIEARGHNIP